MKRVITSQIVFPLILLLSACSWSGVDKIISTQVPTSSISADIEIIADGTGDSEVTVELSDGFSTGSAKLLLISGEILIVSTQGVFSDINLDNELFDGIDSLTSKVAELEPVFVNTKYTATLPTDVENTEFTISFVRSADSNAPNSKVTLPVGFTITQPVSGTTLSRSNISDITLGWSPANTSDSMSYEAFGTCELGSFSTQQSIGTDLGTAIIGATLLTDQLSGTTGNCDILVHLRRSRFGQLDAAYRSGGSIIAMQQRSISIRVVP